MRIAFDARRIRDFGVGTYIRNLLPALGEIDSANEYLLITAHPEDPHFHQLPANFSTVEYRRSDMARLDQLMFPMFLRGLRPDLTHIPLNRVPLLMPRPYVVTIHDLSNLNYENATGLRQELRRLRFHRGLSRAARVIAVSRSTERDVIAALGIPEQRIRVVHNAPDPGFLRPLRIADARAAGPDGDARERRRILERYQIHYPYLLYAGNIRPQKNIPRLVEAFAVVRNELADHPLYRELRLIVIGDQISKYPQVRRAVIQSRTEDRVRFLGFVPFDTLRVFYEMSAAFVFPSLYEGFGLPPLEAMACGAAVVASNTSSVPEVVGDAAELVNPENVFDIARGIREVLTDDEWRAELVARGRRRAMLFNWQEAARLVLKTYQEAVL